MPEWLDVVFVAVKGLVTIIILLFAFYYTFKDIDELRNKK